MPDYGGVQLSTHRLVNDADFQKLESEFSTFCPFEAMGVVGAEIRHSNFLAYMLNPFRPHGFGTAVLEAFIGGTLPKHSELAWGLDDAEVRREWRNIDLLILLPKARRIIAVELKIDASQSADQLQRYRHTVEAHWPKSAGWEYDFVFLTKNDEVPHDDTWISFRLRDLVMHLDRVAGSSSPDCAQGREALRSYIKMMRRHHVGDEALEEAAQRLWTKHGEALEFLMDRRPDPLSAVFTSFRENLKGFIADSAAAGIRLEADKHKAKIARLAFSSWDELPHFRTAVWTDTQRLVLLEVKLESARISGTLFLGPGSTPDRERYAQALRPISLGRFRARSTSPWLCLADEELLGADSATEIDHNKALNQVCTRMSDFTKRVFERFDPAMQSFRAEAV